MAIFDFRCTCKPVFSDMPPSANALHLRDPFPSLAKNSPWNLGKHSSSA